MWQNNRKTMQLPPSVVYNMFSGCSSKRRWYQQLTLPAVESRLVVDPPEAEGRVYTTPAVVM